MNIKFYKQILNSKIDSKTKGINEINKIKVKDIPNKKWNILKENVQFPILTMKESVFKKNIKSMNNFANYNGVSLAPHCKTSMCPQILKKLNDLNYWGFSAANNQQLSMLLEMGIKKIIIANLITNKSNIINLFKLIEKYGYAKKIYLCVDSTFGVNLLKELSIQYKFKHKLRILIETGFQNSRNGVRNLNSLNILTGKIIKLPSNFIFCGILFYEGAVSEKNYKKTINKVNKFISFSLKAFDYLLKNNFFSNEEIILSGGGSEYFDLIINSFQKYKNIKNIRLIIRPGTFIAYGHGHYLKSIENIDKRGTLFINKKNIKATNLFNPSLELWGHIISMQDSNRAILNFGKRDVHYDRGYPIPLSIYRKGKLFQKINPKQNKYKIYKMSDHHAFLYFTNDQDIRIGDLIKLGVTHPCVTIDKWDFFYMIDEKYNVKEGLKTFF